MFKENTIHIHREQILSQLTVKMYRYNFSILCADPALNLNMDHGHENKYELANVSQGYHHTKLERHHTTLQEFTKDYYVCGGGGREEGGKSRNSHCSP